MFISLLWNALKWYEHNTKWSWSLTINQHFISFCPSNGRLFGWVKCLQNPLSSAISNIERVDLTSRVKVKKTWFSKHVNCSTENKGRFLVNDCFTRLHSNPNLPIESVPQSQRRLLRANRHVKKDFASHLGKASWVWKIYGCTWGSLHIGFIPCTQPIIDYCHLVLYMLLIHVHDMQLELYVYKGLSATTNPTLQLHCI